MNEPLPALSSPNPDGHEVEYLDQYIARYELLSHGAPGLPDGVTDAAGRFRDSFIALRARVESGQSLSELLANDFATNGDLFTAGQNFDLAVARLCD